MECKCGTVRHQFFTKKELIDTLWNVNYRTKYIVINARRINRYIMECKSVCFIALLIAYIELIDTLWNVNWRKMA